MKPESIPALPAGVHFSRLDNGLTVIIREDRAAPVVSAQAWCMTGSIHEGRWLGAGLSHVLEHMLFKGTTTRGSGRIDQEVQEAGGYMNAYTSFDRTVYHIEAPAAGARIALDILADIMQHATLPADELAKEQDVIRREMDMNQDDPGRRAGRRLFETAYLVSPCRFTVIGYPDIFNELKRDDITGYYHERYAPNNVFFVVAGDIRADEALELLRQGFAKTKARALPPLAIANEPPQAAPREVIEEAPIALGHVHCSWHIPEARHADVPALDVLATLLGYGQSSRLYQQVREKAGVVHHVDAWTHNPGMPGLFGMSAMVDGDKFERARDAIMAELDRMRQEPVPPEELTKAVKQFTAGNFATRKTVQGQAQDLGSNWLGAHDLNFTARHLAAVRCLTPSDLQRVARRYLTPESHTLYALLPKGAAPRTSVLVQPAAAKPAQRMEFSSGLRLLAKEDRRLPFVEFRLAFKGGVLAESVQTNGVSQLLSRLLPKGTTSRSAERIAREVESVGGSLDTWSSLNTCGVQVQVLREDFALGLDLLADVLLRPSLPDAAIERERDVQLAGIRDQRDHMLQSAFRALRRGLHGDAGYGLDPLGTEASVAAVQRDALRAHHAKLVTPDNTVLAIYGDADPAEVCIAAEKTFASWLRGEARFHPQTSSAGLSGPGRTVETRDKKQAVFVAGFPGATVSDPDRFALELVQEACSDLGSRLFLRIREQLGLAYYVGAQNQLGLAPGTFAFYAGTAPEHLARVEEELLKEIGQLRDGGLTADELNRAKAKTIGQRALSRQDCGAQATAAALDELYGLGFRNWETEDAQTEAVTVEQTRAVAQKFFDPAKRVIAIVEPGQTSTH
ncbi:MAG: insulinase family protein [Verrucomicrobia bacterium]|nr:insulinase family protein [Verrucomicrobiota bacterium]